MKTAFAPLCVLLQVGCLLARNTAAGTPMSFISCVLMQHSSGVLMQQPGLANATCRGCCERCCMCARVCMLNMHLYVSPLGRTMPAATVAGQCWRHMAVPLLLFVAAATSELRLCIDATWIDACFFPFYVTHTHTHQTRKCHTGISRHDAWLHVQLLHPARAPRRLLRTQGAASLQQRQDLAA